MSTSEPEPKSCWECDHGKVVRLPDGKEYVDCPPGPLEVALLRGKAPGHHTETLPLQSDRNAAHIIVRR